jgi:hypothetical protein
MGTEISFKRFFFNIRTLASGGDDDYDDNGLIQSL